MIYTLWYKLIEIYKSYIGTGTLLGLFFVALFSYAIMELKRGRKVRIAMFLLSVWGTICYMIATCLDMMESHEEDSKIKGAAVKVFVVVLCVMCIAISGTRILSPDFLNRAENTMHIPEDLKDSMDVVLADSIGDVGVLVMPEYGDYFKAYNSRFFLAYEEPFLGDVSKYDEVDRQAYSELSDKFPNMAKVARSARNSQCRYIVIKNDAFWPVTPLEDTGFYLLDSCGQWDIYRDNLGVDG